MKTVSLTFLLFLAFSCTQNPGYYFTEPQPAVEKNIDEFPRSLRGKYQSADSLAIIRIFDKFLVRVTTAPGALEKEAYDSLLRIHPINDTLAMDENIRIVLNKPTDALYGTLIMEDTLYELGKDAFFRTFHRSYFLNCRVENLGWEVTKFSLEGKNKLCFGSFFPGDSFDALQGLVKEPVLTTDTAKPKQYIIHVAKKEFRKMSRNDTLWRSNEFYRIK
jgi:hypothetical protein